MSATSCCGAHMGSGVGAGTLTRFLVYIEGVAEIYDVSNHSLIPDPTPPYKVRRRLLSTKGRKAQMYEITITLNIGRAGAVAIFCNILMRLRMLGQLHSHAYRRGWYWPGDCTICEGHLCGRQGSHCSLRDLFRRSITFSRLQLSGIQSMSHQQSRMEKLQSLTGPSAALGKTWLL